MKKPLLVLLVVLFAIPFGSDAQRLRNRWKAMRAELNIGIGASNFLGELGGADQIGTHFFKDFEFSQTRLAIQLGYRYKLTKFLALNTHLTYGEVAGNDNLTKEFYRNYRNLSFESTIYEFNTNAEFAIIKDQAGHRYRLRGVRGQRGFEMMSYLFVGVGVFHFNPKASRFEGVGDLLALHPLGTEGQQSTAIETRKPYKRTQFCIPVGIGFKYTVSRRWGIGIEYGIRKTFTDYIDDASKTYVDGALLTEQYAAEMADKSDGQYPYITAPGAQRGDPRYTDSYMFGVITLNYKLRTGRQVYPLF